MKVKKETEKFGLKLNIQKIKIMASGPITSWQIDGETVETMTDYFGGLPNHCRWWLQPWKKKTLLSLKKSSDQPRQHVKKQRHNFYNKGPSSQGYAFSSSHVWMWEWDYWWALKNWCFWTMVLQKIFVNPLGCKEIQPFHPKWYQSWMFIGRTDIEAEVPILWPPDAKSWLIWKDPDSGKGWMQEKGTTEDEMVGWHHRLNGHEFEYTLRVGDEHGVLACFSPWGRKELDTAKRWTELNWM